MNNFCTAPKQGPINRGKFFDRYHFGGRFSLVFVLKYNYLILLYHIFTKLSIISATFFKKCSLICLPPWGIMRAHGKTLPVLTGKKSVRIAVSIRVTDILQDKNKGRRNAVPEGSGIVLLYRFGGPVYITSGDAICAPRYRRRPASTGAGAVFYGRTAFRCNSRSGGNRLWRPRTVRDACRTSPPT